MDVPGVVDIPVRMHSVSYRLSGLVGVGSRTSILKSTGLFTPGAKIPSYPVQSLQRYASHNAMLIWSFNALSVNSLNAIYGKKASIVYCG